MKILNLYAGIGGNRKLWGDNHDITAVEINPDIAKEYKRNYPKDKVIIADAHKFLENHYEEFDFIWSSPPCPTHSRMRLSHKKKIIPDGRLWAEILFLIHHFKGEWVVENVVPYYDPLIKPTVEIDRHLFWSSFDIKPFDISRNFDVSRSNKESIAIGLGLDVPKCKDARKLLRNAVNPKVGEHIFKQLIKEREGE